MKRVTRDGGQIWDIAENDEDRKVLTDCVRLCRKQGIDHQYIYSGPPGQDDGVVLGLHLNFVKPKS